MICRIPQCTRKAKDLILMMWLWWHSPVRWATVSENQGSNASFLNWARVGMVTPCGKTHDLQRLSHHRWIGNGFLPSTRCQKILNFDRKPQGDTLGREWGAVASLRGKAKTTAIHLEDFSLRQMAQLDDLTLKAGGFQITMLRYMYAFSCLKPQTGLFCVQLLACKGISISPVSCYPPCSSTFLILMGYDWLW